MKRVRCHVIAAAIVTLGLGAQASYAASAHFLDDAALASWSPDGSTLACVRGTSGPDEEAQIWLAPLVGAPTQLTYDPNGAFWPLWLADGQHIVYYRQRWDTSFHYEFVVVDLHGANPVVWEVPHAWDDPGISLSPDGNSVLYSVGWEPGQEETWALDLATGARHLVVSGLGGVISPDGQWIAYTDAQDNLVLGPLGQQPVLSLGPVVFGSWTPDSRAVVASRIEGSERTDLIYASRDGVDIVPLTDDPEIEWYARISPSGQQVVYARSLGEFGPISTWILDLDPRPSRVEATTWSRVKQAYR